MNFQEVIKLIESNSHGVLIETKGLLLKVSDNILNNPDNPKYRTLKKSNALICKHILSLKGGQAILLFMGFKEKDNTFDFLIGRTALSHLRKFREDLGNWEPNIPIQAFRDSECTSGSSSIPSSNEPEDVIVRPVALPQFVHKYSNRFFQRIAETFHYALVYADKELKQRARKKIPVSKLETCAQKKMRDIQEQLKEGNHDDQSICVQDLVLVELLKWFKEDFFTWVDTPDCETCGNKTEFSHNSTDENLMIYTSRVEMHKCKSCNQLTAFPRYEDLNILMETRKGRCGEWANVFTLMCHSMNWDARKVVDETDHVWTEVYSPVQKRWIHCDPCDNACDTPLMYEHGWKKSLSYIIAYSPDDLQDVTWRYSSNHKELLKRRKNCTEAELVKLIIELRKTRLATLSPARRNFILKRTVAELAELLIEKQPKDEEMRGRISGSLDWRVARGEITELPYTPTTFNISKIQIDKLMYEFRYSCALDRYEISEEPSRFVNRWENGIFEQKSIMRKEEKDWKQVYLCRKEGTSSASITWKFILDTSQRSIASVSLRMDCKTFENGRITVKIKGDNGVSLFLPPENHITTMSFKGSRTLFISAELSEGKGSLAWQHAQLFRQSIDSSDHPFSLSLTFE